MKFGSCRCRKSETNDALVQNLYSSICGTDVAVFTHGPNTGHKVNVEMMGFLGMGNNPMVGATVAVAVAVEEALKK